MSIRRKIPALEINFESVLYGMQQLAFRWLLLFYLPEAKRGRGKKAPKTKKFILPFSKNSALTFGLITLGILGSVYFGLLASEKSISAPPAVDVYSQTTGTVPVVGVPQGLERSAPTYIRIPAIGVNTNFIELGKQADGTMQVPEQYEVVGWYKHAPTPGEVGPAIVVGHVDNYRGPAVFWNLRYLKPGDVVEIDRADGKTVKFQVNQIKQFEQNNFPTQEVYGNLEYAGLRLISCGGTFNRDTGQYDQNTVVFASIMQS